MDDGRYGQLMADNQVKGPDRPFQMSFPSITKTSLPGQQHSDLEWDVVCVCVVGLCACQRCG